MRFSRMLQTLTAATAVIIGTASISAAATDGVIPGPFSSINDSLATLFPGNATLPGTYGDQVSFAAGSTITIDYLGREAKRTNTFTWGDGSISNKISANKAFSTTGFASGTMMSTGGLLDFSFSVEKKNGSVKTVTNGSNPDSMGMGNAGNTPNFFTHWVDAYTVYLFLDDGGANYDDDHDDMVVRLTASAAGPSPVPVPAAGFLLLGGLGALGAVSRRRKKA